MKAGYEKNELNFDDFWRLLAVWPIWRQRRRSEAFFIEVELSLYAYFIEVLAALLKERREVLELRKMMTHKS